MEAITLKDKQMGVISSMPRDVRTHALMDTHLQLKITHTLSHTNTHTHMSQTHICLCVCVFASNDICKNIFDL